MPNALADLLVGQTSSVLRYDEVTGKFLGVLFKPGSGGLDNLQGMAIGPDRLLYMSSFGPQSGSSESRAILRYDGYSVKTFVSPGSGGLGAPSDVAFGPDGNLYVADAFYGTNSILRFNGKTGAFIDIFARGGGLQQPNRVAFGPCGNLFVGNATSSDVLRYHGNTGQFFPAKGNTGAIFVPGKQGPFNTVLAFAPDGSLAVASGASPDVLRYDGRTGALLGIVASSKDSITEITFGPDGNLYLANYLGSSVVRYKGVSGQLIGTFIPPGSGGLSRPISLLFNLQRSTCDKHYGSSHKMARCH